MSLFQSKLINLNGNVTGQLPQANLASIQVNKYFYVDGQRTDSYTADGSPQRPFKTISAAITQIITNNDNATFPYAVAINPGNYNEALTFNSSALYNITFSSPNGGVSFGTGTGNAIVSTANNTQLSQLVFNAFSINGDINFSGDINGTNFASKQILFNNCFLYTFNGGVTLFDVNNVFFVYCTFQKQGTGNFSIENTAFAYVNGVEGIKTGYSLTMTQNNSANQPSQTSGNYLLCKATSFYPTSTIDAGSEIDFIQVYTGSGSSITNNGILNSFGSTWKGALTLNSGSTTTILGDSFLVYPTVNAGATFTINSMFPYPAATPTNWNTLPKTYGTALDTLATSGVVKSQTQNLVLASPNGSSGVPSFRALVSGDLPAGTGTVTSVNVSGGTTGLTTSGGPITTSGTITLAGTLAVANGGTGTTSSTGTGSVVLSTSPTLVTPALGTPSALVGTNITGTATGFTSGITQALASATTTVNVSSATAPSSGQVLTATSSTTATWQPSSSGSAITALTGDVTATGPGSAAATVAKIQGTTVSGTTGTTNVVFSNSPTLVTPALGTPSSGTLSNCTGYPAATSSTAGTISIEATGSVSTTFTFNATGGTSTAVTIKYARSGSIVTGYIPIVVATTGTSSTTAFVSNTAIDTWARPTTMQFLPVFIAVNNVNQTTPGMLQINTTGTFTLFHDSTGGANWGASVTNSGFAEISHFSYYVG